MKTWFWLIILIATFFSGLAMARDAIVLQVNGAIGPASQDYIVRGIAEGQEKKAEFVLIQLDTPGGLDSSMRGIIKAILSSSIPVVTYVAPEGARAASAGTYILYASHIAAMAPGTNVGAASPINLIGDEEKKSELTTEQRKVINDAAAYLKSLGTIRNRNLVWPEQAVREASSLPAAIALKMNVIDLIANSTSDLLRQLDGKKIKMDSGIFQFDTKSIHLRSINPDWRYEFLSMITDPSVAYILLLVAAYGIFFEFANPGFVLPGVVGVISLLLALYAFQLLPINYAGLGLLILGVVFMMIEVFISSFGVLGVGGLVAFIVGSIMLFDQTVPGYHIALPLILGMGAVTGLFFFLVISLAVRSWRKKIVTGREELINSEGIILNSFTETYQIKIHGEIWQARSAYSLKAGDHVRVVGVKGLILSVEPIEKRSEL